jgi:hypothetical protein
MKRILNTSSRGVGLNNGGIKVSLGIGGFANIDEEDWKILIANKQIQRMVDARMIMITDGQPLNAEVALKRKSSDKEMPEQFKPKEEKAALGKSTPDAVKVETVEVSVEKKSAKGRRSTAKKSDK